MKFINIPALAICQSCELFTVSKKFMGSVSYKNPKHLSPSFAYQLRNIVSVLSYLHFPKYTTVYLCSMNVNALLLKEYALSILQIDYFKSVLFQVFHLDFAII